MSEIDIDVIKTRKKYPLWRSPKDTFKELEQNQHNIKIINKYITKFKYLLKNMEGELSLKSGSKKKTKKKNKGGSKKKTKRKLKGGNPPKGNECMYI